MLSNTIRAALSAVALWAAAQGAHAATVPAVDLLNTPSYVAGSPTFTVGYSFHVNSDVMATALGAYDYLANGLNGRADVGLFSAAGELLASVSITGTAGQLIDSFRYGALTAPVRLVAGADYVLGSWSNDPNSFFNGNYGAVEGGSVKLAADPRITLTGNRDIPNVTGLVFPSRSPLNQHTGSFGPNMLIEDVSVAPVPVPAAGLMLLSGIGAVGAVRRRNRA